MKENKSPLLSPNWVNIIHNMIHVWNTSHVNRPKYLCLDVASYKSILAYMRKNLGLFWKSNDLGSIIFAGLEIVVVPDAAELCIIAGMPDVELKIEEIRLERKYRQANDDT